MLGKVTLTARSPTSPPQRLGTRPFGPRPLAIVALVQNWWEWFRGPDGSSFTISFLVHAVLLAILAIPISQRLLQGPEVAPSIEVIDAEVAGDPMGDFIDAPLVMTQKALGSDQFDSTQFETQANDSSIVSNAALSDSAGSAGSEDGNSSVDVAGAIGGYLLRAPGNAVKAGRFTAFSQPIIRTGFGQNQRDELGKPGDAPGHRQDYFIVIHIKVPASRKTYPITDLIGSIIGTDGYRQQVPDGMYILDDEGKPQPLKRDKRIKVIKGVVQLLVRVPGGVSGVRDNISLKSKLLREEQNLQLIFQSRKADEEVNN